MGFFSRDKNENNSAEQGPRGEDYEEVQVYSSAGEPAGSVVRKKQQRKGWLPWLHRNGKTQPQPEIGNAESIVTEEADASASAPSVNIEPVAEAEVLPLSKKKLKNKRWEKKRRKKEAALKDSSSRVLENDAEEESVTTSIETAGEQPLETEAEESLEPSAESKPEVLELTEEQFAELADQAATEVAAMAVEAAVKDEHFSGDAKLEMSRPQTEAEIAP